jgi:hypothetical protein
MHAHFSNLSIFVNSSCDGESPSLNIMQLGLNVSPQPSQFEKETVYHKKTLKSPFMSFARIKNTLPHGYNQRYIIMKLMDYLKLSGFCGFLSIFLAHFLQ